MSSFGVHLSYIPDLASLCIVLIYIYIWELFFFWVLFRLFFFNRLQGSGHKYQLLVAQVLSVVGSAQNFGDFSKSLVAAVAHKI
jgi:hypothetical protein